MNPAAEVARIKAEFAARDTTWLATIRARLKQGPATSRQLADACECNVKGSFWGFLYGLKRTGTIVVVGKTPGPRGNPNSLWEWARDS